MGQVGAGSMRPRRRPLALHRGWRRLRSVPAGVRCTVLRAGPIASPSSACSNHDRSACVFFPPTVLFDVGSSRREPVARRCRVRCGDQCSGASILQLTRCAAGRRSRLRDVAIVHISFRFARDAGIWRNRSRRLVRPCVRRRDGRQLSPTSTRKARPAITGSASTTRREVTACNWLTVPSPPPLSAFPVMEGRTAAAADAQGLLNGPPSSSRYRRCPWCAPPGCAMAGTESASMHGPDGLFDLEGVRAVWLPVRRNTDDTGAAKRKTLPNCAYSVGSARQGGLIR